ncbi:MAG TPA: trypsin-like peptidase domain-containing protein [Bryobacteraceae bacterium]|nr:trypsin-like peptidase domain-containing protein [Bryobacteraceae bacterium]
MRVLRPFVWAAVMVAAFLYLTSAAHVDMSRMWEPVRNAGRIWTEPAAAATAGGYTPDEQNNIEIYRGAHDATVNIRSIVVQEDWFWGTQESEGAGSGFIVNSDGEILTNNHVVTGSAQLTVSLSDKKTYKARILARDRRNDLALIKIDAGRRLPALRLGDSDGVVVGQKVLAIGNPFGIGTTLTTGIISSLDRSIRTEGESLEGMLQTDAAINPGNSGGPLLDSHGAVIGINTAILGSQGNIGLGFALPINRAKEMLEEFTKNGHISRPILGLSVLPISGDLAEALDLPRDGGLLVQRVEPGMPAAEAGVRGASRRAIVSNYPIGIGGDLITAIDGQPVDGSGSLQRAMNRKHGGDWIELTIYRNGRKIQVRVKLGSAPQEL